MMSKREERPGKRMKGSKWEWINMNENEQRVRGSRFLEGGDSEP